MATKLVTFLTRVRDWANKSSWRTWVTHGTLAIPITFAAGSAACIAFYLLRELEQLAHEKINGVASDYTDHVLDVLTPALVALGYASTGLWTLASLWS